MGKAQKIKVSKKNQVTSVAPLGDQLDTTEYAAPTGRVKERSRREEDEDYVESRLSKNIITQARIQVNWQTVIRSSNFHLYFLTNYKLQITDLSSVQNGNFCCLQLL